MKLSKSQSNHRLGQFSSGCYRKPHVRLLSRNCIYLFISLKMRQNVLLIFCFHQIFVNLRVFSTSYSLNKQSTILWPSKWYSFKWQIINCFHFSFDYPPCFSPGARSKTAYNLEYINVCMMRFGGHQFQVFCVSVLLLSEIYSTQGMSDYSKCTNIATREI